MSSFSANLRKLMKARGCSIKHVSNAIGIPASTLSEWCAGRLPRVNKHVVALARYFDTSVEFLITGESTEENLLTSIISENEKISHLYVGTYRVTIEKVNKTKRNKED